MSQDREARAARWAAAWSETWVWFCVTVLPWITLIISIAWWLK